jgi:hypothetical protein
VLNDSVCQYPFNMFYLLEGLPVYSGNIPKMNSATFFVQGKFSILDLGRQVLPYGLSVTDSGGREYMLHLNNGVGDIGSFIVNQNTGRITVVLFPESREIIVSYYQASSLRPSAGITFASLLTYQDPKTIISNNTSPSFSLESNTGNNYLLINSVTGYEGVRSKHLVFNKFSDKFYTSAKIDLETKNKYISPAIKNIYMTIK